MKNSLGASSSSETSSSAAFLPADGRGQQPDGGEAPTGTFSSRGRLTYPGRGLHWEVLRWLEWQDSEGLRKRGNPCEGVPAHSAGLAAVRFAGNGDDETVDFG